ncbi:hypothetical protein AB0M36_34915 [Actinoplanes sp. NPDC051346]|uniref:hypothetical protein n=1 Tax=Actinoplanes sp. NPDC051346 TaxID=3155048 RepID=UPI00342CA99A
MPVDVLLDRVVEVDYGQFYIESGEADEVGAELAFRGQRNGLCGAAVPGALFLVTGLRNGPVACTVRRHSTEPPLEQRWEDVVEVSFRAESGGVSLREWDGVRYRLDLPPGDYRVRYCARGMQQGWDVESLDDDQPVDHYLLEFWAGEPTEDRIVRQTSEVAAYWHREHAGAISAPAAVEQAQRGQAGDRVSNDRLRAVRLYLGDIKALDENLMYALAEADDDTHRVVARWSALQALSAAGVLDLPAVAPAVAALRRSEQVPAPFDDEFDAQDAVEETLPQGTVARIAALGGVVEDDQEPVSAWNAVLAVVATARPDSLEAALDAVVLAAISHGDTAYEQFLEDLHRRFDL